MTESETLVEENWPTTLTRRNNGCDYLDEESGALVEVKTKVLMPSQVTEMVAYHQLRKPCQLVVVDINYLLIFNLESIIGVTPKPVKPNKVVEGSEQHCPHCQNIWWSRTAKPKACPRCKSRIDSPYNRQTQEVNP